MEVNLLGSIEVLDDDGNPLPLSGTGSRILLTALSLRCGEVVADDHLVEMLWGDATPSRSVNALQRQISTLRRSLGSPALVERRGNGYVLTVDRSSVDVFRFDALAARGHNALRDGEQARAASASTKRCSSGGATRSPTSPTNSSRKLMSRG